MQLTYKQYGLLLEHYRESFGGYVLAAHHMLAHHNHEIDALGVEWLETVIESNKW